MSNWQSYIKEYQNYLKLERGLSKNTIDNYTFDVEKLVLQLQIKNLMVEMV
jgi:integrase/recombinase XerD